jgi:hypothetical protein
MEHNPSWETNSSSASQEGPHFMEPPLVPDLIPVQTLQSYFFHIHFNSILPSTLPIAHMNIVCMSTITNMVMT